MGQFRGFQIASGAIASHHLVNDIAIRGLFSVQSGVTLSGTLVVHSGVQFKDNLFVSGNTALTGTLGVSGAASLASTLNVASGVVLSDTLSVASGATFLSGASFAKAVFMSEGLRVSGDTVLNNLEVTGASIFSGNVTISGALGVSGATSLAAVTATGAGIFTSSLGVSGAATLNSLDVTGASVAISGTLSVSGASSLAAVTAYGNLGVSGTSELRGNATALGNLGVSGTTELRGNADALGNLGVSGAATLASLTVTGAAVFQSTVTLSQDPAVAMQAATKQYVDHVAQGLNVKNTVRVATTAALSATSANYVETVDGDQIYSNKLVASSTEALTIDEVALAVGDRVLVKNQGDAKYNGIYVVSEAGDASTAWELVRAVDGNIASEITKGAYILVQEGTSYNKTAWVQTQVVAAMPRDSETKQNNDDDGGDEITFVQFSGAGTIVAGVNMFVSGNTLSLGFDGASTLSGAVAISGASASLSMISGAGLNLGSASVLTAASGSSILVEDDAAATVASGATLTVASGAVLEVGDQTKIGHDLAKLLNGSHVVSGADALHSHSLGALGIKEAKATAQHIVSAAATLNVTLAEGYNYASANFAVASGTDVFSWSSVDLEVYLNGQLIEYNTNYIDELVMPCYTFDEQNGVVQIKGGLVSGDHVHVRYFAKSSNV